MEGRQFHIITDHKPLTFALNTKCDSHSPRQARHLDYISQFTTDIRHVKGTLNVVADALSRMEANAISNHQPPCLNFTAMAQAQQTDPELMRMLAWPDSTSLQLQQVPLADTSTTIVCDNSTGPLRPFVPAVMRRLTFDSLHSMSHPGIRATQKLIKARFVWPNISRDCKRWTQTCTYCQRAKVNRHSVTPLSTFIPPSARFDSIHIDLVGPLPPSRGQIYLLTCIDRFTRWPEVIPLIDIRAESVAAAFLQGWISRFGVPSTVTTDRGAQFESALWNSLMQILGTKRLRTTAYHPIANGLIERFHRHLKAALKCQPQPDRWMDSLPLVMLGIRSTIKEDLGCTTAEMVYGSTLRLPGEFFTASPSTTAIESASYVAKLRATMKNLRPPPVREQAQRAVHLQQSLFSCTHVFVRRDAVKKPLQPPYDGPYKVLDRSDKYFKLSILGKTDTVSVDRLKPAHLENTSTATTAPTTSTTPSPPATSTVPATSTTPTPSVTITTRTGRQINRPERLDL